MTKKVKQFTGKHKLDKYLTKEEIKKGYDTHFGKALSDEEIDEMLRRNNLEFIEFDNKYQKVKDLMNGVMK